MIFQSTMSFRSLSLCALLLRFHPIFSPQALAASDTQGTLNLYDDNGCGIPSTLNPRVNLLLSTCLVTTGGEGLEIDQYPTCSSGTAILIYYQDTACGNQYPYDNGNVGTALDTNCFQIGIGGDLYNARSVMFSCQPAANNPLPSSTTTAVVSALAAVATGSNESNGSGSGSSSGSSTSAASSTPTDTSTQKTSTSSNSNGGTGTSTNTSFGSGLGLSTSDIIALAVGFGTGIPTLVIAFLAWRYPKQFKAKVGRIFPGRPNVPASQGTQPHQWHPNGAHEMEAHQQPWPHAPASQGTQPYQWHPNGAQEMDSHQQSYRPY